MQKNILAFLACPHQEKKEVCRGKLFLVENYLVCRKCQRRYPIFFGIPLLVNNLADYLRENLPVILALAKKYKLTMDPSLLGDALLLVKQKQTENKSKELFSQTKKQAEERIKNLNQNPYFLSHYGNFNDFIDPDHPLANWLKKQPKPHSILADFLKKYAPKKVDYALEIGSNVGGFLPTLAKHAKNIVVVENSFEQLFVLSCLFKHWPTKINSYEIKIEGYIKKSGRLKLAKIENLILIAASGGNLPFEKSFFDLAVSCNVLDIIDEPLFFLEEQMRILKKNGLLLSSDPYQFLGDNRAKLKLGKNQKPWERIKKILITKMKILEELDNTPWIMRLYQRAFTIYSNHSFCAKKK